MMKVTISTPAVANGVVGISEQSAQAVRMGFNPSSIERVDRLKALAAAFLSECDLVAAEIPAAAREAAVAKTNMQTASMWAVLAATTNAG